MTKAMNKKELKKQFPWITKGELDYELNHVRKTYKTEKGFVSHLSKMNENNADKFGMCDVKTMHLDITWRKTRTWGYCPTCEYEVWMADGTYLHGKTHASGYGYDKHSTVVAEVFNICAKGMAWRKRNSKKKAPYGIAHVGAGADKSWNPYFEGGIGITCYPAIVKFLGGTMESREGRTWDYHEIRFGK